MNYSQKLTGGNGNWNVPANWNSTVAPTPADDLVFSTASVHAMNLAVDKCLSIGVGLVSVYNSHHFGAAGCYSKMAADRAMT